MYDSRVYDSYLLLEGILKHWHQSCLKKIECGGFFGTISSFFHKQEQGGSQDGLGLSILTRGNNGNILNHDVNKCSGRLLGAERLSYYVLRVCSIYAKFWPCRRG